MNRGGGGVGGWGGGRALALIPHNLSSSAHLHRSPPHSGQFYINAQKRLPSQKKTVKNFPSGFFKIVFFKNIFFKNPRFGCKHPRLPPVDYAVELKVHGRAGILEVCASAIQTFLRKWMQILRSRVFIPLCVLRFFAPCCARLGFFEKQCKYVNSNCANA